MVAEAVARVFDWLSVTLVRLTTTSVALQVTPVRLTVTLFPLMTVLATVPQLLDALPSFHERLVWFLHNRADLVGGVSSMRGVRA